MEIITLVKANIKHKKGSFISIVLLLAIISLSVTFILSMKNNCDKSLEAAWEDLNPGELIVMISDRKMSDELLTKVENSRLTDKVIDVPGIESDAYYINDNTNGNSLFMRKQDNYFKAYNAELDGYIQEDIKIRNGEIWFPVGVKTNYKCNIGDMVSVYTIYGHEYDFIIAGFIVEPVTGGSVIGWKQAYVSDEDFNRMSDDAEMEELAHEDGAISNIHLIHIYQDGGCSMTSTEFRRALNKETGIVDFAFGSMPKSLCLKYTLLLVNIITASLLAFMFILMVVVFIVMGHSISTGIQIDYAELGILKSQGFSKGKIRLVFICQYLFAELLGILIGFGLAVPAFLLLKNLFFSMTGILSSGRIDFVRSSFIICSVFLISILFVLLMTGKVAKISPIRAISGGKSAVYFDSYLKSKISKKRIHTSIALRQFTSNSRRYIGITVIVSILVFFMMTAMILGNILNSKTALESIGMICNEINIDFKTALSDEQLNDIEEVVEQYTPITHKYYLRHMYLSLNGEETMCRIMRNPEEIPAISKGRAPLYDNEIVITDILADEYKLSIGDEVVISHDDKKASYIITGYNQSINDVGMIFSMSLDGAKKVGIENVYWGAYSLDDAGYAEKAAADINQLYGDLVSAEHNEDAGDMDSYNEIISIIKVIIYVLSVIFASVVVHMVCIKTFIQERHDIGIYKACGFTSGMLRLQFAVRFLIISIFGSLVGLIFSVLLSGWTIAQILRLVGISVIKVSYTPLTFILPILVICFCFFIFAYAASRKIKYVETRELVME